MKLTKEQKEIIKQDIIDLKYLSKMYEKQGKYDKASGCLEEMNQLMQKLGGVKNEQQNN